MKQVVVVIILTVLFTGCQKTVSVLVVAGGHDFDTTEFFEMFRSLEGIRTDSVFHPEAMDVLYSEQVENYDVIAFYDFIPGLPQQDSAIFLNLVHKGIPMLFLHHSICTFQQWDGYMKMVGGRYVIPEYETDTSLHSDYRHDISMAVQVVDPGHPVTLGMEDFTIYDEGYSNIIVLPGVTPLLQTGHPDASPLIGWAHKAGQSNIVYLMPGHDKHAYENPAYRRLLSQSILWLAGKL